jgi:hypothetical protein
LQQLPQYGGVTYNLTLFGSRRPDHLAESMLCQEDACACASRPATPAALSCDAPRCVASRSISKADLVVAHAPREAHAQPPVGIVVHAVCAHARTHACKYTRTRTPRARTCTFA